MQQQISLITLGVADLHCSLAFYRDGFGWEPVFEAPGIAFFQMNGLVLGLWSADQLAEDMRRPVAGVGAMALAYNVASEAAVDDVMAALLAAGGSLLRPADAPPHGGYRGYVADPDGHAWEIAHNPAWKIDADGRVHFGL